MKRYLLPILLAVLLVLPALPASAARCGYAYGSCRPWTYQRGYQTGYCQGYRLGQRHRALYGCTYRKKGCFKGYRSCRGAYRTGYAKGYRLGYRHAFGPYKRCYRTRYCR